MNLKWHDTWKEVVLAYFDWYLGIFVKALKRTTEKFGQNSRSVDQGWKPAISGASRKLEPYWTVALLETDANLSNMCRFICFFEIFLYTDEWRLIDIVSS
jgi:hypothetical protein